MCGLWFHGGLFLRGFTTSFRVLTETLKNVRPICTFRFKIGMDGQLDGQKRLKNAVLKGVYC